MIRWNRLVNMAVAHIRRHANAETIEIVFHYQNPVVGIDRAFNLNRNIGEPITLSLNRIKTNIQKEYEKKLKKTKKSKKSQPENAECSEATVPIDTLVDFMIEKNETTTWLDLLANVDEHSFKDAKLKVFGQEFSVAYNHPYVVELTMPSVILIGFDCSPVKFEVAFTERDKCRFEWYRGLPTDSKNDSDIVWNKCEQEGFFYRVQQTDLYHKLKVKYRTFAFSTI